MFAILQGELGEPRDAVFAHNDLVALWIMAAVAGAGLRVPDDVAVIGVDGLALSAEHFPPLSTVSLQPAAIGAACVAQLSAALSGTPRAPTVIEPRLIARTSTIGRPSYL